MCTLLSAWGGWGGGGGGGGKGGLNLQPNFQQGGDLTGPQLLEGVAVKEGSDFFQGGLQFSQKKKN